MNDVLTRLWRLGKPLQWRFLWLVHAKFICGITGVVRDDHGRVLLLRHRLCALPTRSLLSAPDGLGYPELAATPGGTGGRPGAGTWQAQRADGSDPLTLRPLGRRQMISGWGASGQQHELPVGASAEAP